MSGGGGDFQENARGQENAQLKLAPRNQRRMPKQTRHTFYDCLSVSYFIIMKSETARIIGIFGATRVPKNWKNASCINFSPRAAGRAGLVPSGF
jgi:hypothetical protein